jgi:type VI secretion system protein ImpH
VPADTARNSEDLIRRISDCPHRFDFFQLVFLLEQALHGETRLGGSAGFNEERIRMETLVQYGFPAADIHALRWISGSGGREAKLQVLFPGLYGINSPLPPYFLQMLLQEEADEPERAFVRGFLDIFNNRYMGLFCRTWRDNRPLYSFRPDGQGSFIQVLFATIGLNAEYLAEDHAFLYRRLVNLGLQSMKSHMPVGFCGILAGRFPELTFAVKSFVRRRIPLPAENQTRLGGSLALGNDAYLGTHTQTCTGAIRVSVGPLDYPTFQRFLPGGGYYEEVRELSLSYLPPYLDHDLEISLRGSDIPPLVLGDVKTGFALGRSSWLPTHESKDVTVVIR